MELNNFEKFGEYYFYYGLVGVFGSEDFLNI